MVVRVARARTPWNGAGLPHPHARRPARRWRSPSGARSPRARPALPLHDATPLRAILADGPRGPAAPGAADDGVRRAGAAARVGGRVRDVRRDGGGARARVRRARRARLEPPRDRGRWCCGRGACGWRPGSPAARWAWCWSRGSLRDLLYGVRAVRPDRARHGARDAAGVRGGRAARAGAARDARGSDLDPAVGRTPREEPLGSRAPIPERPGAAQAFMAIPAAGDEVPIPGPATGWAARGQARLRHGHLVDHGAGSQIARRSWAGSWVERKNDDTAARR